MATPLSVVVTDWSGAQAVPARLPAVLTLLEDDGDAIAPASTESRCCARRCSGRGRAWRASRLVASAASRAVAAARARARPAPSPSPERLPRACRWPGISASSSVLSPRSALPRCLMPSIGRAQHRDHVVAASSVGLAGGDGPGAQERGAPDRARRCRRSGSVMTIADLLAGTSPMSVAVAGRPSPRARSRSRGPASSRSRRRRRRRRGRRSTSRCRPPSARSSGRPARPARSCRAAHADLLDRSQAVQPRGTPRRSARVTQPAGRGRGCGWRAPVRARRPGRRGSSTTSAASVKSSSPV